MCQVAAVPVFVVNSICDEFPASNRHHVRYQWSPSTLLWPSWSSMPATWLDVGEEPPPCSHPSAPGKPARIHRNHFLDGLQRGSFVLQVQEGLLYSSRPKNTWRLLMTPGLIFHSWLSTLVGPGRSPPRPSSVNYFDPRPGSWPRLAAIPPGHSASKVVAGDPGHKPAATVGSHTRGHGPRPQLVSSR